MSAPACPECKQAVGRKTTGVECDSCLSWFHVKCVDLSKSVVTALSFAGASWKCERCRRSPSKRASGIGADADGDVVPSEAVTLEAVFAMVREMRSEVRDMKGRYEELLRSVTFCSDRISDFEATLNNLNEKSKLVDRLAGENADLKSTVSALSARIEDMEQYSRRNNLEIRGIGEVAGEDIVAVFSKIVGQLEVELSPSDVDAVHRVARAARDKAVPRSIIVRFSSRRKRDQVLAAAAQKRRSGGGSALRIDGISEACYINDHLTPANKKLFANAKIVAKDKGYKYVWSKDCKIFIRKSDSARAIRVVGEDTLSSL